MIRTVAQHSFAFVACIPPPQSSNTSEVEPASEEVTDPQSIVDALLYLLASKEGGPLIVVFDERGTGRWYSENWVG